VSELALESASLLLLLLHLMDERTNGHWTYTFMLLVVLTLLLLFVNLCFRAAPQDIINRHDMGALYGSQRKRQRQQRQDLPMVQQ